MDPSSSVRQQLLTVQLLSNLCLFLLRDLSHPGSREAAGAQKQALDDGIYFNACSFADKLDHVGGAARGRAAAGAVSRGAGRPPPGPRCARKYRLFDADTLLLFDQDGNNPAANHSATTAVPAGGGVRELPRRRIPGGHGSSNNNNNNNNGGGGGKEAAARAAAPGRRQLGLRERSRGGGWARASS